MFEKLTHEELCEAFPCYQSIYKDHAQKELIENMSLTFTCFPKDSFTKALINNFFEPLK